MTASTMPALSISIAIVVTIPVHCAPSCRKETIRIHIIFLGINTGISHSYFYDPNYVHREN